MVPSRALVFRPLVKGNEDSGNEIENDEKSKTVYIKQYFGWTDQPSSGLEVKPEEGWSGQPKHCFKYTLC